MDDDNAPEPASDLEPSPEQQQWSENYSKLAAEYHQNGGSIAHITQSRTSKPNVEYYKMRMFVETQRKAAKNGLLSKEQIFKLVAVGFDFGDSCDNACGIGGDDENIDKEQNNNPTEDHCQLLKHLKKERIFFDTYLSQLFFTHCLVYI